MRRSGWTKKAQARALSLPHLRALVLSLTVSHRRLVGCHERAEEVVVDAGVEGCQVVASAGFSIGCRWLMSASPDLATRGTPASADERV